MRATGKTKISAKLTRIATTDSPKTTAATAASAINTTSNGHGAPTQPAKSPSLCRSRPRVAVRAAGQRSALGPRGREWATRGRSLRRFVANRVSAVAGG